VILKSYIVEQNINILKEYQAILLYGENDGIKDDIKLKLKNSNKDSEIINLFENEILKNKNILFENIVNESLFNKEKKIFIGSASDKIFNEIVEALEKIRSHTQIYIFADKLDTKSKLRNLFQQEKKLAIFPCYADNDQTLIAYIDKELSGYKGLTGEIINLIIKNSSANRKIIQGEIVKIRGYFIEKIINKHQLLEILNIKDNTNFDEIRDSALRGKNDRTNELLSEIDFLAEDCFFYLNNLNYRVLRLIEIQTSNEIFKSYEKSLSNIKPPVFWKDKPIYLEQLKKWDIEKLKRISYKIGETEVLMKRNSEIKNNIIIKNLIITLSKEASISS